MRACRCLQQHQAEGETFSARCATELGRFQEAAAQVGLCDGGGGV